MQVLVVGSGGRESTLCWKIAQSKRVGKIYCAPGNGGVSEVAECVDIKADDIEALVDFAKTKSIDLTVVGPEAPLVLGIVDRFNKEGLRVFGPDKEMARLEGSKVFAKETMKKFCIPTADFRVFDQPTEAKAFIEEKTVPLVIKADGLCAGKGVIIAKTHQEAEDAVDSIMVDKEFGTAGEKIIIEDCLEGEEASIILASDGEDFVLFASSQDHKRALDNDEGPNTGGMGAYSPAPIVTEPLEEEIRKDIITPIIDGLLKEGTPYKGVLYIGLMIVDSKPYVLEFNVRFGDPETQAVLPRLKTDIVDIIEASIDGRLSEINIDWDDRASVCVVCASGGYPGSYKKGFLIEGLDKISGEDLIVFHAGTVNSQPNQYKTSGGRVLGVVALGEDIEKAINKVYQGCSCINFEGMHYRKDIGYRVLKKLKQKGVS